MTVLLQVSDPHFGTERAEVMAALETFSAAQSPDVLLLSGDITQRATRRQFAAARAFVDRLRIAAVLAIPGNHDIPLFNLAARLWHPYGHYSRAFGTTLEPEFENDHVLVVGVKTTRRYRHKDGEVSAAQIERVARRLETASAGQCRVVMVHQPVAVVSASDRANLLRGNEEAVRGWATAGADVIVGGHIHLPFVVDLQDRWPDLGRRVWAVQAGTALSTRVRPGAGNSVNLMRTGAGCRLERWDYDEAAGQFALADRTELALSRT